MADLDLQEQTRRDDMFININNTLESLKKLDVFPSLVWLWCWDVVVDIYENNHEDDMAEGDIIDEVVPHGVTLKQIWDKFWEDSDKNGFTLEYGAEDVHEAIQDWMRDSNFLVSIEEEDEEEEDVE